MNTKIAKLKETFLKAGALEMLDLAREMIAARPITLPLAVVSILTA
jgi:hypothetical protein